MKKIITLLIVLFFVSLVYAIPSLPHGFWGTASGSNVVAKINGVEVERAGITDGNYVLVVRDDDRLNAGKTIYFFVDGVQANENAIFEIGGSTNLDLTLPGGGTNNGGGGGGGNNNKNSNSQNIQSSNSNNIENLNFETQNNNNENTIDTSDEQDIKSSGITGGVIGFAKSGIGIGLIFAILVIIVVIAVVGFRKKRAKF